MPHSDDEPPSAPVASVGSDTPTATVENQSEATPEPGSSMQDGEVRRPRRRRRRRRPETPALSQAPIPVDDTIPDADRPAGEMAQGEQGAAQVAGSPPRRRRRRRHGPSRDSTPRVESASGVRTDSGDFPEAPTQASTEPPAEPSLLSPDAPTAPPELRRRRRRRRRPGSTLATSGSRSQSGSEEDVGSAPPAASEADGRPRPARPHDRRAGGATARSGVARSRGPRQPREGDPRPREAGGPGPDRDIRRSDAWGPRNAGSRDRSRRDGRSRGSLSGRGREAPPRKPEQKLYALESVVDRGFDDVPNESEEGGVRRVHWTIVKRTVADQKSGKTMSAAYVLQRDGVEAEYPNLGAARAAVNKTIVHPEKLTLSKAEHVAAKASR